MAETDWLALGSAVLALLGTAAAIVSAIWTAKQGRAAKREAAAAEHQVILSKAQLAAMERANELTEKHREEERAAQSLKLDLSVRTVETGERSIVKLHERLWIEVVVRNTGNVVANIQEIAAVFADGSRFNSHKADGQLEGCPDPNSGNRGLPAKLERGAACSFRFGQREMRTFRRGAGMFFFPPRYDEPRWRTLTRVELLVSNQLFVVPEGDGEWRRKITEDAREA